MAEETHRPTAISLNRVGTTRFEATNERGGTLPIGSGDSPEFTPSSSSSRRSRAAAPSTWIC